MSEKVLKERSASRLEHSVIIIIESHKHKLLSEQTQTHLQVKIGMEVFIMTTIKLLVILILDYSFP